MMFSLLKKKYL